MPSRNSGIIRCQLQRTRHGRNPNSAGAVAAQHPRTFSRRRSRRVNIIYKKHFAASDFRGTRDGKSSAQVGATLMAGQADLGLGVASAVQ